MIKKEKKGDKQEIVDLLSMSPLEGDEEEYRKKKFKNLNSKQTVNQTSSIIGKKSWK